MAHRVAQLDTTEGTWHARTGVLDTRQEQRSDWNTFSVAAQKLLKLENYHSEDWEPFLWWNFSFGGIT